MYIICSYTRDMFMLYFDEERESNTHEIKINLVGFFYSKHRVFVLMLFSFSFYSYFLPFFQFTICFLPCLAILSKEIWFPFLFLGLNCVFVLKINFNFSSIVNMCLEIYDQKFNNYIYSI